MNKRLAILAVLLAATGCVKENGASIEIFETCFPPTPSSSGVCSWPATCSAGVLGTYLIDVAGTDHVFLGVQVNNQLAKNGNPDVGGLNGHDAFVDTYTVDYELFGITGLSIPSTTGPAQIQNTVPAAGSAVVGVNAVELDATTLLALQTAVGAATGPVRIEAHLRLHGVLGDTTPFDTASRIYPIDVCVGCMGPPACTAPQVPATCPGFFQGPSVSVCITPS